MLPAPSCNAKTANIDAGFGNSAVRKLQPLDNLPQATGSRIVRARPNVSGMKKIVALFLGALLSSALVASLSAQSPDATPPTKSKIGVLLVNHGSRSATWRQALMDLETKVRPTLLTNQAIQGVKTAFMEYTEPSTATRLKEFDAEGFTDVVLIPIFLTVSSHTFDDIPTIIGQKTDPQSLETMKLEKIERYAPKARTVLAPNLDFTGLLKTNVTRRVRALSQQPEQEGVVLIAYGDATYEREWAALFAAVGDHVKAETGISASTHGWCGHLVHYSPKKTTEAVEKILATKSKAIVIPVLVAHDENFQIKIIGGGISKVPEHQTRVIYRPDAILPDPGVEAWIISITNELVGKIQPQARLANRN